MHSDSSILIGWLTSEQEHILHVNEGREGEGKEHEVPTHFIAIKNVAVSHNPYVYACTHEVCMRHGELVDS